MLSVSCDGCAGAVSVLYLLCVIYYFVLLLLITHREDLILSRVSHNIQTYYRAGLIDSGVVI